MNTSDFDAILNRVALTLQGLGIENAIVGSVASSRFGTQRATSISEFGENQPSATFKWLRLNPARCEASHLRASFYVMQTWAIIIMVWAMFSSVNFAQAQSVRLEVKSSQIALIQQESNQILWLLPIIVKSEVVLVKENLFFISKDDFLYRISFSTGIIIWKTKANVYRIKSDLERWPRIIFTENFIILEKYLNTRGFDFENGKYLWSIGKFSEKSGDEFGNFVESDGYSERIVYSWVNSFLQLKNFPSVGPRPFQPSFYVVYDASNGREIWSFSAFIVGFFERSVVSFNGMKVEIYEMDHLKTSILYDFTLDEKSNIETTAYKELRNGCKTAFLENYNFQKDNFLIRLWDDCGGFTILFNLKDYSVTFK